MSTSERLSFEPFNSLSGVLTGAPIRVFPEGTFYRGERKLTVTKDRLQEFAANLKAGLPRFDIPINIEHNDNNGRYGTVKDLEYFETGPSGPGLYATRYELTPAGRVLLEQEKFIGLSGEAIWTLFDGAKYQDPTSGTYHDNVLVGLALTNKPFFGKEVNLYSAEADTYRSFTADERKKLAKSGAAMPGGRYPIANAADLRNAIHAVGRGKGSHAAIKAHIKKRAAALGLSKSLPDNWDDPSDGDADDMAAMEKCDACGQMNPVDQYKCSKCGAPLDNDGDADNNSAVPAQGAMTMADEKPATPPAPEPEKFTLSAEQFKALQTKAGEVDKLHVLLAEMKHAGRVKDLTAHVKETFASLPVKPEELAEKFAALEAASPDLFTYFDGLLATLERQVATGDLFSQIGSEALPGGNAPETFSDLIDAVLAEKFGGDMAKYADAMQIARAKNPALAAKYESTYSKRPSKSEQRAA